MIAFCTASRRLTNCSSPNWSRRDAREHAEPSGPRSRRSLPPGSCGASAIFAGYVGVLQDLERLYIAAHTLGGTSASYGFPRFSEIAGKLAHVFQYALNAPLGEDLHGPLTEFLSDGISLLETDLLDISDTGHENIEDIAAFKDRYRFAFPTEPPPLNLTNPEASSQIPAEDFAETAPAAPTGSYFDALPSDDEVPDEILEFFQPEAEEHLQVVSDCLLSLEAN